MKSAIEKYESDKRYLFTITSGLLEMAHAAGRYAITKNMLLRECYGLQDEELRTVEEWEEVGAKVKENEHAFMFWKGEDVVYRYTRSQVIFEEVN